MSQFDQAREAASFLRQRLPATLQNPQVAIVCGSGLGGLAGSIRDTSHEEFDYSSIPHFPHLSGSRTISYHLSLVDTNVCYMLSSWACWQTCFWSA